MTSQPGDQKLHNQLPNARRPVEIARVNPARHRGILHRAAPPQTSFRQFFLHPGPLTLKDLERFARLEKTWPTAFLPDSVLAGGALRLHVWTARRPTPFDHLDESAMRLPVITRAHGHRAFFTKYARSTFEPKDEGGSTNKCPLCGNHLLGFPMADHSLQHCPFRTLKDEDRIHFIAINSIGFCPECNSRSGTHYGDNCTPKKCEICGDWGHTLTLSLCNHPHLGKDCTESRRALFDLVDRIRKDSLQRIQSEVVYGAKYKYRSHVDSSYDFWDRCERPNRLVGWCTYDDHARQFRQIELNYYNNYYSDAPPEFPTMVPVELALPNSDPHFAPALVVYLEEIGRLVTLIRNNPDVDIESIQLPLFPTSPGRQVQPVRPHLPAAPRASTSAVERPLSDSRSTVRVMVSPPIIPPPSVKAAAPYLVPTPSRPVDRPHRSSQLRSSNTNENTRWPQSPLIVRPKSDREFPAMMEDSRQSTSSATQPRARPPSPEPVSESKTPETSRFGISTSSTLHEPHNPRSGRSQHLQDDELEITVERNIAERVRLWCKETVRIDGKPARPAFMDRAFRQLPRKFPIGREANFRRAQTLIFLLTGSYPLTTKDLYEHTTEKWENYAIHLFDIAVAIKEETIIIVKYEDDLSTFLSGPIEGSRYFLVPSMEVFQAPAAAHIIDRTGRDGNGRLLNLTFPSPFPPSKWFGNPEEDQSIEEPHTLPQQFPPFDGTVRDMVSFHDITLLDIPRHPRALAARINWLLPFLTGERAGRDMEDYPPHLLTGYTHVLMATAKAFYEIERSTHKIMVLIYTDCPLVMAETAAGGHSLALPSFDLYKRHPLVRWRAWLEAAWNMLEDQQSEEPFCPCYDRWD